MKQNELNEKELLGNVFDNPIVLVTYEGNVLINEQVKVLKYDLKIDDQKPTSKLNVLFAFPFAQYETIKAGITLNQKVEAQKLKPIKKVSDRPIVATKDEYEAGVGRNVKLTMRTGHGLTGEQVANTQYNLIVKVCDQVVLVYKHGILEYQVQEEGGTDGSRTAA